MMHPLTLACIVLFGSIGVGFFIYGKNQKRLTPLICGLGLMVFPYFVSSLTAIIIIGILLSVIPCFIRL